MNRGIVGNLVGFKSVMLFVLAFAVLFCPGGARAQDTLMFKDIYVDFHGATANHVAAASGVLAASDIDKDIFRLDGDGNVDYASGRDGMVNPSQISTATQTQMGHALGDYMARPIVANFESAGSTSSAGDELVIMAIIEGVTPSWVTSMKDGSIVSDGKTGAQLLSDMLTAEFDKRLFAGSSSSSLYSGLSPSSVTSINLGRVMNAVNGGVDSSTSSLVIWDLKKINGLVVSATNPIYSRLSLSATMYINGGDIPAHVGPTNLVGLETGSSHARFLDSPASYNDTEDYIIKYVEKGLSGRGNIDADINKVGFTNAGYIAAVTDYSSLKYYTGKESDIRIDNPMDFLDDEKEVPFQFRHNDYLTIKLDMRINEDMDGEPDEYFGPYSDTLEFSGQSADANSSGRLKGAKFTITAQLLNGNEVLSSAIDIITPSTAGDQIVDVSASISDALVTSSSFQKMTLVATFTDEIGAATSMSLVHAVDTAAPFITNLQMKASGTDSEYGDVGVGDLGNPTANQALLNIQIDGNGEQNNKAKQWLNVSVRPSSMNSSSVKDGDLGAAGVWTPDELYHLNNLAVGGNVSAVSEGGALITGIPADLNGDGTVNEADLVGGASVTVTIKATEDTVSIRHAGLIVCVSDDARNPALVYPAQSRNEDQTLEGASSLTPDSATAYINTLFNYFSVSTFSPFVVSNDIRSSTVEIDNIGPLVLAATLSVVGLPNGYWESGDPGYNIASPTDTVFSLMKQANDTTTAPVNDGVLKKLGISGAKTANLIGAGTQVLDVTRGTAADSNQAGSPLKLVVKFKPKDTTDTYKDEDTDEFLIPAAIKNGVELFNSRFNFEIVSSDLGYATKGIGVNAAKLFSEEKPMKDWAARWNLADATIFGSGASAIAYATFYDLSGIPQANYSSSLTANQSGLDETVTVWISDKSNNYGASKASNQIVVDVSKVNVSLTGKIATAGDDFGFNLTKICDGRQGATSAATVLLVTDTDGRSFKQLVDSDCINLDKLVSNQARAAGTVTNNKAFLNSSDVVNATAVEVRAGYTIIISATFQEPAMSTTGSMTSEYLFVSQGENVYFPYGLNWKDAQSESIMDVSSTLYGRHFKTISADFSDFTTGDAAKMVLPDVTELMQFSGANPPVQPGSSGVGAAQRKDIIAATWFYYINGDTINYDFAPSDIRSVTLQARDLSGNVSSINVKVATADFNIPEITILDYQFSIPKRGITSTIIERDTSYGTIPADKAAVVLSQATANLEDSTAYVYVKIGTGTTKGGPFTSQDYVQCDFRPLGGELVNPNMITYPGGAPVTSPESVGVNEIVYATFWSSKFENVNDSGGAANRKIVVYATASSLGVGTKAPEKGVQVDHLVPDPTIGDILENDQAGNKTNSSFDLYGDGQVRPGQVVSLNAKFTMDNADKANQVPIITEVNASEFGATTIPYVVRTLADSGTVYSVTWTWGVSSTVTTGSKKAIVSITDAAGNDVQKNSPLINILGSRPTILSTIVSASNYINYVTQAHALRLAYHNVGQKSIGTETIWEPTAVVRAGDMLTVTAVVNINDNAYTGLQSLTADFSDFGGDSAINPTQSRISGTIVTATWENVIVTSSASSKHAGVVRFNAVNPAGVAAAAGPMLSAVSVAVDNTPPIISYEMKYYKEKDGKLEVQSNPTEFNPSKSTYYASVVASVTYTDSKTLADMWKFGNGASMLAAMVQDASLHVAGIPKGGSYYPWFNLLNSKFINDNIGLTAPDFWALSQSSSVWHDSQSSTDGPVISGATATMSNIAMIKNSTNNVINLWYGIDQFGNVTKTMKLSDNPTDNHKVKDYAFILSASDAVGNIGKATMQPVIEVDVTPPAFTQTYETKDVPSKSNISLNGVDVTNISKLDVKYVEGNKYTPAIFSGPEIIRPTRVTIGTVIVAEFEVSDSPDKSDEFEIGIWGDEFDAENFKFVNVNSNTTLDPLPSGIADYPLADPEQFGYTINPGLLGAEVMHVTMEFTVGKDAVSDFPVAASNEITAVSPARYINNNELLNSVLIFEATDTMENHSSNAKSSFLEVDTKGPIPLTTTIGRKIPDPSITNDPVEYPGSSIFSLPNLESVQSLSTVPNRIDNATTINAMQGSWIVWAATIVVDGTEPENLSEFSLNWSTFEEDGSSRFMTGDDYIKSGTKPYLDSATRSILFVTAARKLKANADSHDAKRMVVTMADRFGNKTEHKTGLLAIGSSGPNATELVMTIDGKPQTVFNNVEIGIGKAIDASEASLEIYPGASLIVEATVNTIGGEAPDNILLDLSDLYPAGMNDVFNKIVPSVTMENAEGSIYVKWDTIAYDFWKVTGGITSGTNTIADQDVINGLMGTNRNFNGMAPLINDVTVTASSISLKALQNSGVTIDGTGDASLSETVSNIIGLPGIMVQPGAAADTIALVTIYVDDSDSLFNPETFLSTKFALDTQSPRASITFSVTRALKAKEVVQSGIRKGFPAAPSLDTQEDGVKYYNRVREKDNIAVIVDITNALINGKGNDKARALPGLFPEKLDPSPFLSMDKASMISNVTIDLTEFNSAAGNENVYPTDGEFTVSERYVSGVNVITATFFVEVAGDKGVTAKTSNKPIDVTPTLVDDAGNRPYDNVYDQSIKRYMTDLAVDNTPPSISGSLKVGIVSGTATIGEHTLGAGSVVEGGASIAAGSTLSVTVTVTDTLDHPLDIINNTNYGTFDLSAENLKIDKTKIIMERELMSLTGDSVSVPFIVTLPEADEGQSTLSFQFIVHATDTLGNYDSKASGDKFQFDSNPNIDYKDGLGNLLPAPVQVTLNAAGYAPGVTPIPSKIVADVLDVGGLAQISWVTESISTGITYTAEDSDGTPVPTLTLDLTGGPQSASLSLDISAPVGSSAISPVYATAMAKDIMGNTNEKQTQMVQWNINQPPVISNEISYVLTSGSDVTNATVGETLGLGFNTALADIREVTMTEGEVIDVLVSASDINVPADAVIYTVTGSALSGDVVVSEATYTDNGDGTVKLTLNPGYKAVTGEDKAAKAEFQVMAGDAKNTAPDTILVVVNIKAKSAVPTLVVTKVTAGTTVMDNDESDLTVAEGQTLTILLEGKDAGDELLDLSVETLPTDGVDYVFDTVSAAGIANGTFTFTPDADAASVGNHVSPIDPFLAKFIVKNSTETTTLNRIVGIENANQAPVISATASVTDGGVLVSGPIQLGGQGTVTANAGDVVKLTFVSTDPDATALTLPNDPVVTKAESFTDSFEHTNVTTNMVVDDYTLTIPESVSPAEATVTIVYTVSEATAKPMTKTATYTIVVVPKEIGPADLEDVVIGQGFGGNTNVRLKSVDNFSITGSAASAGAFLSRQGGGSDRAVYVSTGDLNGDGNQDFVSSMGPITSSATFANTVIAKTSERPPMVIGNAFQAFQKGTDDDNYNYGDIRTAVGNFIGSTTADQIAVAQGFGGNNVVRIYQYTGRPRPDGFAVVAQFNGLAAGWANNASGGLTLAAGDLDGDDKDELVVGQTPSNTSRTQFRVLDIAADGSIENIATGVAFPGRRTQQGSGGIEIAVVDLDGAGLPEIVFAQMGNTQDYETDTARNTYQINAFTVQKPILVSGVIQPFTGDNVIMKKNTDGTVTNRYIDTFWTADVNPSGAVSVAGIEANALADGKELIVGTGAVYSIAVDGDKTVVQAVKPAPLAKYTFLKLDYDGTTISGYSNVVGQSRVGFGAFANLDSSPFDPTSGAVFVGALDAQAEAVRPVASN